MSSTEQVKLLDDAPASEDAFGSHNRIAEAIAQIVREERGGRAIALVGTWGSGKSTVIKLLDQELADDKKTLNHYKLVCFDAWSHENDPLRRSFLEHLIDNLLEPKTPWLQRKKWLEERKLLAKKVTKTTTKSGSNLTWRGLGFSFAAFLVPLGLALIGLKGNWLYPGVVLAALPALILSLIFIAWFLKRLSEGQWAKPPQFLSALISQRDDYTETEGTETPDPTSIEFQEKFQDLLKDALQQNGNRHLIICIDNLDRLDAHQALTIWATMRTFFEPRPAASAPWLERLWLIVPFDKGAMDKLWPEQDASHTVNGEMVKSFKEKTFDISFDVSPPILKDFKLYFHEQFESAFGNLVTSSRVSRLYRIFYLEGKNTSEPFTPRDVKVFINNLGGLYRQWREKIDIEVMAAYLLLKKVNADELVKKLANGSLVPGTIKAYFPNENWHDQFAALYYNVEVDQALHVLLGRAIGDALPQPDGHKSLETLQGIHGFYEICEEVVEEVSATWSSENPTAFPQAARNLDALNGADQPSFKDIWARLANGAMRVPKWSDLDGLTVDGLCAIIQNIPEDQLKTVVSTTHRQINATVLYDSPETARIISGNWLEALARIDETVAARDVEQDIAPDFKMPPDALFIDAPFFVGAMHVLNKTPELKSRLPKFSFDVPGDQVVGAYVALCGEAKLTVNDVGVIQHLTTDKTDWVTTDNTDWDWTSLASAAFEKLDSTHPLPTDAVGNLVSVIRGLAKLEPLSQQCKQHLKQLCTRGRLFSHLHPFRASGDKEPENALAICLFTILEHCPQANISEQWELSEDGVGDYKNFCSDPRTHDAVFEKLVPFVQDHWTIETVLVEAEKNTDTRNLMRELLLKMTSEASELSKVNTHQIIKFYERFMAVVQEETASKTLGNILAKKSGTKYMSSLPFGEVDCSALKVACNVVENWEERKDFAKWLKEGIASMPGEDWNRELAAEECYVELLITLSDNQRSNMNLGLPLKKALVQHARGWRDTGTKPSKFFADWNKLLDALIDDYKEAFLQDFLDLVIENFDNSFSHGLLDVYEKDLFSSSIILDRADEIVRIVFRPILENLEPQKLAWLRKILGERKGLLPNAKNSSRREFKERIKAALEGDGLNDEQKTPLTEIARLLKIKPKTK